MAEKLVIVQKERNHRRFGIMRNMFITIFTGVVVLLLVSSCATVPTEPLAPGELRLLSMRVPEGGNVRINLPFEVNILFEATEAPEIKRACFYWSGDGPYCAPVSGVTFGSPGSFKVELRTFNPGSFALECFAEYVQEGRTKRTNRIVSQIFVIRN